MIGAPAGAPGQLAVGRITEFFRGDGSYRQANLFGRDYIETDALVRPAGWNW
jgi:hypothetical protein